MARAFKGKADQSIYVFIQDASKSDGSGLGGLTYLSAGLTCYYYRHRAAAPTSVSLVLLANLTVGHTDGGFLHVGSNFVGLYRLDLPDAAFAAGTDKVLVKLSGATNMAPCVVEVALEDDISQEGYVASGTPSTTSFIGDSGLSASDDFYNGAYLVFISGANKGIARKVTDYVGSTKTFTVQAFPTAPSVNDRFVIIGNVPA